MNRSSEKIEHIETIIKYREYYKHLKTNHNDEAFAKEYSAEIKLYIVASKAIKESYDKVPKSKEILSERDDLQEKKEYPYERVF